jgi:molecular chaperone DnaJ
VVCARNSPPSDAGNAPNESQKNEGFLKSAWHKLMNSTKNGDGGNSASNPSKKESGDAKKSDKESK